jgi:ParB family chromosome partitioning protein
MAAEMVRLPLGLLDPPARAHRVEPEHDDIAQLADSIRAVGLINPLVVRPTPQGRYEVIAGHRRLLACQLLRLPEVPCLLLEAEDGAAEEIKFQENLERKDLSPMEEARAIADEMARTGHDIATIARRLNRSEWWVRERLAMLDLPSELQQAVHERRLPAATARYLARITDDDDRRYYTEYALSSGASAAVVREWVEQWQISKAARPEEPTPRPVMPSSTGERVSVQVPCYVCGTPVDYRDALIVRVCPVCDEARRDVVYESASG